MQRRTFLMGALAPQSRTVVEIEKDGFKINGRPTYEGRSFLGAKVEGILITRTGRPQEDSKD